MALCCIGGVCIPYSALLPFLAYGVQWLLAKLIAFFPVWLQERLRPVKKVVKQSDSCCTSQTCSTDGDIIISQVETNEQWNNLLQSNNNNMPVIIICKFTASWCQPCKKIQPVFESLAKERDGGVFCIVDVDDMEEIASEYKVAMLPTFLVLKGPVEVARYAGSDESQLRRLVDENL